MRFAAAAAAFICSGADTKVVVSASLSSCVVSPAVGCVDGVLSLRCTLSRSPLFLPPLKSFRLASLLGC